MKKTEDGKTRLIGYIRVSTRRQEDDGQSLEAQARQIRAYCDGKPLSLLCIEEDIGSAAGPQSHLTRKGLRVAIEQAKAMSAPIIVTRVDRLSRHPAILRDLSQSSVRIISIQEGGLVGMKRLRSLLEDAQQAHEDLRRHTRDGVSKAKSRGRRLGNPESLTDSRRSGTIANCVRVERKVTELADFLETVPGWEQLTRQKLVDLLNAKGPLNLISEKREERRAWTTGSLRRPLVRAKDELLSRAQLEDYDSPDIVLDVTPQPVGGHPPVNF